MRLKIPLVLTLAMVAQVAGNILLSKGVRGISLDPAMRPSYWIWFAFQALQRPKIWLGVLLLIIFFGLFTVLLSWADLSFILPASSFGYILNVALAHYILLEPVSVARWSGTALIFIGVILVSATGSRSAEGWEEPDVAQEDNSS